VCTSKRLTAAAQSGGEISRATLTISMRSIVLGLMILALGVGLFILDLSIILAVESTNYLPGCLN
jgi:hypothetical protein